MLSYGISCYLDANFQLLLLFLCYFSLWAFCLCYFYTFFNYGYDGPVICGYWKLTKLSMSSWQFNSRNWSQALGLIWNMSSAGTRVAPSESRSTHQLLLTFGSDRLLLITSSQPCIWILKTWLLDLQFMQNIAHGCLPSSHSQHMEQYTHIDVDVVVDDVNMNIWLPSSSH